MRNVLLVSAITAVVTAAATVFAIEFSGFRPEPASSAPAAQAPAGEAEGEIKGDVDCNLGIEAVDALKLLQDIAAIDYLQDDPCTPVGDVILGEPIPGPQGPPGPPGPAGPQGAQGGPGISGWELIENIGVPLSSVTAQGNGVSCPEGKKPIGGGAQISDSLSEVAVTRSRPTETGWTSAGREMVPTNDEWSVDVYVICAVVEE